jgi:hypothetical protein
MPEITEFGGGENILNPQGASRKQMMGGVMPPIICFSEEL